MCNKLGIEIFAVQIILETFMVKVSAAMNCFNILGVQKSSQL